LLGVVVNRVADADAYGGANAGNLGTIHADAGPLHGRPFSAAVTVPPLAAVWLAPADQVG
jgi:1,4-alpha-glucan branching enzyme